MSDVKIAVRKTKPKQKKKKSRVPRSMGPINSMILSTSWTEGPISSSSTGTIATTVGVSISNAPEYSVLSSLFTQVHIISAVLTFSPKAGTSNTATGVLQGRVWCGTNMIYNSNNAVTPAAYSDVLNLPGRKLISTSSVRPVPVRLVVPPSLEYSGITTDSPSTVTPWAGSPGVFQIYGSSLTASMEYFDLDVRAVYSLRGRQ